MLDIKTYAIVLLICICKHEIIAEYKRSYTKTQEEVNSRIFLLCSPVFGCRTSVKAQLSEEDLRREATKEDNEWKASGDENKWGTDSEMVGWRGERAQGKWE